MEILGNMLLLFSCSRVLTSLIGMRMGTVSVGEANDTIMGCQQCINSLLQHCVEFKKMEKRQKIKNCILQKTLFYFCIFTSWKWFWGLMRVEKNGMEQVCSPKNFFDFLSPVRCEIFEISSYTCCRLRPCTSDCDSYLVRDTENSVAFVHRKKRNYNLRDKSVYRLKLFCVSFQYNFLEATFCYPIITIKMKLTKNDRQRREFNLQCLIYMNNQ